MMDQKLKPIWHWQLTAIAFGLLFVSCCIAVTVGPVSLSASEIIKTIFGQNSALNEQETSLLLEIRLPRVALAALVGAALATSGAPTRAASATLGNLISSRSEVSCSFKAEF